MNSIELPIEQEWDSTLAEWARESIEEDTPIFDDITLDYIETSGDIFELKQADRSFGDASKFLEDNYDSENSGKFLFQKLGLLFIKRFTADAVTPYVHVISTHGDDLCKRVQRWSNKATLQKLNNEGLEGANGDQKRGRSHKTADGGGPGGDSGCTQTFCLTTRKVMHETLTEPELCARTIEERNRIQKKYKQNSKSNPPGRKKETEKRRKV